jgi:hypothetical protein
MTLGMVLGDVDVVTQRARSRSTFRGVRRVHDQLERGSTPFRPLAL